jgi:hypothetical protein
MSNTYHERVRAFSGGNIAEENRPANHKLLHLKIPRHILFELERAAMHHEVPIGRFTIELLRSWASRQSNKRIVGE